MDFNVASIPSAQLDALFETGQTVIKTADDVSGAQKEEVVVQRQDPTALPYLQNLNDFEKDEEKEKKVEGAVEDEKEKKEDTKEEDKDDDVSEEDKKTIPTTLKNTFKFLVKGGHWKDFEGSDDLEFTEEIYAELSEKQAQEKVTELFSELLDSTGEYGKAIISHIKNGGNPDEIIDLFKEQKSVEAVDVSNEVAGKDLIQRYYSEIIGWKKEKIDKFINSLESEEDGVENESSEVKEKYGDLYKRQIQEVQKQREVQDKVSKEQEKKYIQDLVTEINEFEGFTSTDKKLIADSILKTDKFMDGNKVNNFYLKFAELQQDPKKYIELIHFVVDNKGYKEKVQKQQQAEVTKKTWNFIKGNNSVDKKGSNLEKTGSSNNKQTGFTFK